MERDMTISHGASELLRDRLFLRSDLFKTVACTKCGLLAEKGQSYHKRYSYVVAHITDDIRADECYCRNCKTGEYVRPVQLPYAFKLFIQEMAGCHVGIRLLFEENQITLGLDS